MDCLHWTKFCISVPFSDIYLSILVQNFFKKKFWAMGISQKNLPRARNSVQILDIFLVKQYTKRQQTKKISLMSEPHCKFSLYRIVHCRNINAKKWISNPTSFRKWNLKVSLFSGQRLGIWKLGRVSSYFEDCIGAGMALVRSWKKE